LKNYLDKEIPVLYGGSVNSENVLSYLSLETVDGVLVGGASAKSSSFLEIIKKAEGV
jgi:triosephosphate isomerase